MDRHPRTPGPATVIALIALFVALGGPGYAARIVRVSYATRAGTADTVDGFHAARKPKPNTLLPLNRSGKFPASVLSVKRGPAGPQGQTGAQGPAGPPGPATGAAGGALAGTYPDPSLADGAVTPSKVGAVPAAAVYQQTKQTIATASTVPLTFDTESFDLGGLHTAANAERLTAPIAGVYAINGDICWPGNSAGDRMLMLTAPSGAPSNYYPSISSTRATASAANYTCNTVAAVVKMGAGEWAYLQARQDSGTSLTLIQAHLSMVWEGPAG